MGGNSSYDPNIDGVPEDKRTHLEYPMRIDGHKILVLTSNVKHKAIPMNSNSEHPIYLIGKVDRQGNVVIEVLAEYTNHRIRTEVDIEVDVDGNLMPFNPNGGRGTHMHLWKEKEGWVMSRESHDKNNAFEVDSKYNDLIIKVIQFNNEKHKWKEK